MTSGLKIGAVAIEQLLRTADFELAYRSAPCGLGPAALMVARSAAAAQKLTVDVIK